MHPQGKKNTPKTKAVNLDQRNLLIFFFYHSEGLFFEKKNQSGNNVVGWVCQPFSVIQLATQFSEELKTTV